jgi:aminopeptidase N
VVYGSLARQPEIIAYLSTVFGPYPFSTAGAVVDDADFNFSLENQTRPIYSPGQVLAEPDIGLSVVVHELAHQWFGNSVTVRQWKDTWLNEGFATYASWLWTEHQGGNPVSGTFERLYEELPADDGLWERPLADPGTDQKLSGWIYLRGAMTLQVLRRSVGDEAFFDVLRAWTAARAGGNATTDDFVAVAEKVAGRSLDDYFQDWVYAAGKPARTVYPG